MFRWLYLALLSLPLAIDLMQGDSYVMGVSWLVFGGLVTYMSSAIGGAFVKANQEAIDEGKYEEGSPSHNLLIFGFLLPCVLFTLALMGCAVVAPFIAYFGVFNA